MKHEKSHLDLTYLVRFLLCEVIKWKLFTRDVIKTYPYKKIERAFEQLLNQHDSSPNPEVKLNKLVRFINTDMKTVFLQMV